MIWVLLVLAYGTIKGLRDVLKKKALEKNTVIEVLFLYTLLSFIILLPTAPKAFGFEISVMLWVAVKSFAVFLAWIFSFKAIGQLPVSLYGVLDLSRVLFATLLGVIVLGETMGLWQIAGLCLVIIGLLLLKFEKRSPEKEKSEHIELKFIIYTLLSCMLNAFSGLLDKILLSNNRMNDVQLQFWYMLLMVVYYLFYIIVKHLKINWKATLKNMYVWLLAILFVVADKCLFVANTYPDSKVTVMTLIKQSSCIVTILCGKLVFKEKHTGYRLLCACTVIIGILLSVLL